MNELLFCLCVAVYSCLGCLLGNVIYYNSIKNYSIGDEEDVSNN